MRRFAWCWVILGMAACDQAQTPSNVGGDGIDRGAASAALGSVEGTACSELAGPRGKVHVTVVFAPDGNVTDAKFDRDSPDAKATIAGTPRGDCLLARFRDLHVPAFRGAPTKVGRHVVLD
jgi:hypothetical protein